VVFKGALLASVTATVSIREKHSGILDRLRKVWPLKWNQNDHRNVKANNTDKVKGLKHVN